LKQFKTLTALVLALMLVFSVVGTALAGSEVGGGDNPTTGDTTTTNNGDLTSDSSVTINGLEAGDSIKLIRVLQWEDGTGWKWTIDSPTEAQTAVLTKINAGTALTKADYDVIVAVAEAKGGTAESVTGTSYTKNDVSDGMYVALVTAGKAGTLYNPIIVSADFDSTNNTNTIDASTATYGGNAVAKKKPVTVTKDVKDPDLNNGENFKFKIETQVPAFTAAYNTVSFTIKDTVSQYLSIVENSVKIGTTFDADTYTAANDLAENFNTPTVSGSTMTITAKEDYLRNDRAPQTVFVSYEATLNVPVAQLTNVKIEENEVSVEFPNNPTDETKKTAVKDETRQYTFTIDGSLFGNSSWKTSELVKVGKNADGTNAEAEVNVSNGTKHAALQGATFGVYKTEAAATAGTPLYTNSTFQGTVVTDASGLMTIPGLDAGEYWIKELDAPNGYIKDQNAHKIEIIPHYGTESKTEYYHANGTWSNEQGTDGIACTYEVSVLTSYDVKIDGTTTSTFTMTNQGPETTSVTPAEQSTEIVNPKGAELPSTGGIGTTIFYVAGIVMVLGAAAIVIARRKAEQE